MKELKMDDASPKILLIPADRPLAVQAVAAVVDYVAHVGATKIQIYTGTQLDSDSLFGGFVFGGFVSQIMSMLPPDSCSSLFTPDLNPTGSGTVPSPLITLLSFMLLEMYYTLYFQNHQHIKHLILGR
jgi:hypothetical protein